MDNWFTIDKIDVFKKLEGQWIFEEDRGACVGIERTEICAYGVFETDMFTTDILWYTMAKT